MNEFENIEELKAAWGNGNFEFPDEIQVAGIPFRYYRSYHKEFIDVLRGVNAYVVYHAPATRKDEAKEKGLNQWIIMLWGFDGTQIRPYDIRVMPAGRARAMYEQVETIGDVALLKIQLPSGVVAVKGKVDTGAEISSLHADGSPKIVGDMVKFFCRPASQNAIQAPLVTKQQVKSADGGTEYRPVIELDIEINGQRVSKAMFNLNDRTDMEYPVLIGQNILEKTNFLVNPKQNGIKEDEEVDAEWLTEEELTDITDDDILALLENDEVLPIIELHPKDPEMIERICEALEQSGVTITDLFKHVRTKAVERFDDVEY